MSPPHLRNDAKAAWMIAALGDFEINAVRRREAKTRRVPIGNVSRPRRHEVVTGIGDPGHASVCHALRTGITEPGYNLLDNRTELGYLIETDEGIDLRQRFS